PPRDWGSHAPSAFTWHDTYTPEAPAALDELRCAPRRASEPITVRAERVRQRTYRSRHGIAPLPPQTSLSAKCRTLSARVVKAPSVNEQEPVKRDRYHAWTWTQSASAASSCAARPGGTRASRSVPSALCSAASTSPSACVRATRSPRLYGIVSLT